jgi:hypothetical protein
MPDSIDVIVQRMLDADEPEENIVAVINAHKNQPKLGSGLNKPIKSASTWGQGVLDSITSGEAAMAGLKGAGGWLKGAVNLPKTIMGTLDTVNKLPNPAMGGVMNFGGGITNPQDLTDVYEGIKATPGHMWDTTMKAGSKPFEFGEMMGELTGQPLVTEGLNMIPASAVTNAAARGVRATGRGVTKVGKGIETHTPLSGMIPRIAEPRIARTAEGAVGRGIAKIGESLQRTGTPRVLKNSDYGPVPFTPETPLKAPGGSNRGAVSYPETNQFDPSVTLNNEYGPIDFQPDVPLRAPTGSNRGSMSYPELNDTPPSLVPNSSAASDEFVNSVLAPGGEMRGSMYSPDMNPMPEGYLGPGDYGGINTSPERISDWGTQTPNPNKMNLWAEPSGEPTAIINRPPEMPPARGWQPPNSLASGPIPEPPPSPQNPFTARGDIEAIVAQRVREEMAKFDDYVKSGGRENGPSLEVIEEGPYTNNASGESGASVEAMNRLSAMKEKGEVFVVYDRAGRKRPLIGADAVDYVPKKGETFGIQSPAGFKPLVENGGIHPNKFQRF